MKDDIHIISAQYSFTETLFRGLLQNLNSSGLHRAFMVIQVYINIFFLLRNQAGNSPTIECMGFKE